jgi:hypothetical protein
VVGVVDGAGVWLGGWVGGGSATDNIQTESTKPNDLLIIIWTAEFPQNS